MELRDEPQLRVEVVPAFLGAEVLQDVGAGGHLGQQVDVTLRRPRLLVLQREDLHRHDPTLHLRSPHAPVAPPGFHLEQLQRAVAEQRGGRGRGRGVAGRQGLVVGVLVALPHPHGDEDEDGDGTDGDEGVREGRQDVAPGVVVDRSLLHVYNKQHPLTGLFTKVTVSHTWTFEIQGYLRLSKAI